MILSERVPASRLMWLLAGFIVWSIAFVALYSVLSVGCVFGWDQVHFGPVSVQRAVLVALLGVSLAAGWWVVRITAERRRAAGGAGLVLRPFMETAAWMAAWAALASTLFSLGPVLFLTACH
ncbi:hypothetical protein PZ895_14805 [Mesorhizobium sp. YIM 152430]|uniref:hypothetical protein n=1 Tax=Mesorhizobium sp. YIM 152430 TaxID=3031761 RepID=UPI0023DB74B2|nr:hypothetical protein [Mesorhizobium sp. YIM 152430]MDF1601029.1 hypothetical protein [Mesorhizobium sp. YIM 152430]